jgi:hypothetical protein
MKSGIWNLEDGGRKESDFDYFILHPPPPGPLYTPALHAIQEANIYFSTKPQEQKKKLHRS